MNLSNKEISFYKSHGYIKGGKILNNYEINDLRKAYDMCLDKLSKECKLKNIRPSFGLNGKIKKVYQIRTAHLHHNSFNNLLYKNEILDKVELLIGKNIRLILMQALYKPANDGGEINWHQDDFYFRVNKTDAVTSCWITLDKATTQNGCMWVIPKAHNKLLKHKKLENNLGYEIIKIDESKAVPQELEEGECLFHHGLLPHKTLANTSKFHRRSISIHFMDALAKPKLDRQKEPFKNMPLLRGEGISWNK